MNKKYVVYLSIDGESNVNYFNNLKDALDQYDNFYELYAKDNFKDDRFVYLEISIEQGEGLNVKYSIVKKAKIGIEYVVTFNNEKKFFNDLKMAEKFFETLNKTNLFNNLELILFRSNGNEINRYEVLKSIKKEY